MQHCGQHEAPGKSEHVAAPPCRAKWSPTVRTAFGAPQVQGQRQ